MKKIKTNLIEKVTFANFKEEAYVVSKSYQNKRKLNIFFQGFNSNVYDIAKSVRKGEFNFSVPTLFLIREHKYRIIMAQSIPDKIVSHFLTNKLLKPNLEKKLIRQNVATRVGLGSSEAYRLFYKYLNSYDLNKNVYALKIDIQKFFYSVSHEKLKEKLKNDIDDDFAIALLNKLIEHTNRPQINVKIAYLKEKEIKRIKKLKLDSILEKSIINQIEKVPLYKKNFGISIGDCSSQFFAAYITSDIDRYVKETLKIKGYIKYMDDFILLHNDKKVLEKAFIEISKMLNDLDLIVNPKSGIYLVNYGFTFLGNTYSIKKSKIIIRVKNKTYRRVLKKLRRLRNKDFNAYYLSKASYLSVIEKNKLYSLKEEVEFLKNKYNVPILYKEGYIYKYDKSLSIYKEYKNRKKEISFINYLEKRKESFIVISETKVNFYNISLS